MKSKIQVSVFGCCVSRDIIGDDASIEVKQFISFISPLSLTEDEYLGNFTFPEKISPWFDRNLKHDYKKDVFKTLEKLDYLILDIADIRYFVCKYYLDDGVICLTNGKATQFYDNIIRSSDKFKKIEVIRPQNIDEQLLYSKLSEFCKRILEIYESNNIILIEPYYSNRKKDGSHYTKYDVGSEWVNPFLEKVYRFVEKELMCRVIKISKKVAMDPNHKWGLGRLHYEKEVYDNSLQEMKNIMLNENKKIVCCDRELTINMFLIGGYDYRGLLEHSQKDIIFSHRSYHTLLLMYDEKKLIDDEIEKLNVDECKPWEINVFNENIKKNTITLIEQSNPDVIIIDAIDCRLSIQAIRLNNKIIHLPSSDTINKVLNKLHIQREEIKEIKEFNNTQITEMLLPFINELNNIRQSKKIILSKLNYPRFYINKSGEKQEYQNKIKTIKKIQAIQTILEVCLEPDYTIEMPKNAYSTNYNNPFQYDANTVKHIKKQLTIILNDIDNEQK